MKIKITALIIVIVMCLVLLANPVNAAWRVSPDIIDDQVRQGNSSLPSVSIGNQSDQPADFKVELAGYGQKPDGSTNVLDQDSNPLTARPYIKFAPSEFHLNPGAKQQIDLNITIPTGSDGGKYAVLLVVTSSSAGSGVSSVTRLGVPIRLTIFPSELVKKGTAKIIAISKIEGGKPISITTNYLNQGNVHYEVQSSLIITNAQGDVVGNAWSQSGLVLPGFSRDLVTNWSPESNLPKGIYQVKASVLDKEGILLSEAIETLEISTPYDPPPPLASISLIPNNPAALKADNGSVSINFPLGAAAKQTSIVLRNYPQEQLPFPPAGYTAAVTCFQVDGMNGPLAKDALITVRYSSSDLAKAENDASRLKLVRWDGSSNQWSLTKTTVDQSGMQLTASSNQLGLWAVMVGTPQASPVNGVLISTIVGAAALVLIVILLIIYRRKAS